MPKEWTREEFDALTEKERFAITDEEYRNIPCHVKRTCDGCGHLKLIPGISYCCGNPFAVEAFGTALHRGNCKCRFWIPQKYLFWSYINK